MTTVSLVNIDDFLKATQSKVNAALKRYLPALEQTPEKLHQAMHYAIFNGGKRVRAALVYGTAEALQIHAESDLLDRIALNHRINSCFLSHS